MNRKLWLGMVVWFLFGLLYSNLASAVTYSATISPQNYDFGSLAIGQSRTQVFTITNTGNGQLSFANGFPLVGAGFPNPFSITSNGCSSTISPGASCSLTVAFSPVGVGVVNGSLAYNFNEIASLTYTGLSGTGTSTTTYSATISPQNYDFGSLVIGQSRTQVFTITNTGNGQLSFANGFPLVGAGFPNPFSITSNGCSSTISPGASCSLTVAFSPVGVGVVNGSLAYNFNEIASLTYTGLSGTGTGNPLIPQQPLYVSANPTSINVNGTSTLSTTGGSGTGAVTYALVSGPCTLVGATLTGTGAGTCSVTATKAADATYASATSSQTSVTVSLAPQSTLTVVPNPTSINVNGTSTLGTTGGSGTGAVTYALVSGPCTLVGATLTGTGAGTCSVTATKAADATYASATSSPASVTVSLAPESTCTLVLSATSVQPNQSVNLSASGCSSSGPKSYTAVAIPQTNQTASVSSSPNGKVLPAPTVLTCPISGTVMTPTGGYGVCQVTLSVAADSTYAGTTSTKSVTVTAPPAPIPSLSEYAKAFLVFLMLGIMGWNGRRVRI